MVSTLKTMRTRRGVIMKKITVKFSGEFTLNQERFNWFLNAQHEGNKLVKESCQDDYLNAMAWIINGKVEEYMEDNYTDTLIHKMDFKDMKSDQDHHLVRTKVSIDNEVDTDA